MPPLRNPRLSFRFDYDFKMKMNLESHREVNFKYLFKLDL